MAKTPNPNHIIVSGDVERLGKAGITEYPPGLTKLSKLKPFSSKSCTSDPVPWLKPPISPKATNDIAPDITIMTTALAQRSDNLPCNIGQ